MVRMDFVSPVQSLIPGVQGRVLDVLAQTTAELNLGTLARLAGVSQAQASRVLPRLVALGVVERRDVPPSSPFRLVRENLMAQAIVDLTDVRDRAIERLRVLADGIRPVPANLVVFGSFARGEADVESDVDVLVVRRIDVDEDDERWGDALSNWLVDARRVVGNSVNHIEIAEPALPRLCRGRLGREIVRDAIVLLGRWDPEGSSTRHSKGADKRR